MATLSEVSQGIIGGILYYIDWAEDEEEPPSSITIAQKNEGPLQFWLNDVSSEDAYPFVTLEMSSWPAFGTPRIKQVEATFSVKINILVRANKDENPYQKVRQLACGIVDNLMITGNLNLDYVNNMNIKAIRVPAPDMQAYLLGMGRGEAAAIIELDITCTYEPYSQ